MKGLLKFISITGSVLVAVAFLFLTSTSCRQDKCKGTNCANGGICIDGVCNCPVGYQGHNCDTLTKQHFIGTWSVSEKGTISPQFAYTLFINSDTPANGVMITNMYNYFVQVRGTVKGDTLFIPNQEKQGKVLVGTGIIAHTLEHGPYGAMYVAYKVVDSVLTYNVDDFGVYPLQDGSKASVWIKQ